MAAYRRRHGLLAGALAVCLLLSGCTSEGSVGDDGYPEVRAIADALTGLGEGLPSDPAEAAGALVSIVREGADPVQAVAATAELLRRAGIPLVTIDGDVVAMPDTMVFDELPVYVELIPGLTRSVREESTYPVETVGAILELVGAVDRPVPWEQLAGTVALWGRVADDPPEVTSAAATVRALSGQRGRVFSARLPAEGQGIDALALIILLAHMIGDVTDAADDASGDAAQSLGPAGGSPGHPAASVPMSGLGQACDAISAVLEAKELPKASQESLKVSKGALTKAFETKLEQLMALEDDAPGTHPWAKRVTAAKKGVGVIKKVGAYISTALLLLGTRLQVTSDKPGTHYKHEDGSTAENIDLTALVDFHSPIPQKEITCFALAGVKVPKNGPLTDLNVKWNLDQDMSGSGTDIAGGRHLRPVKASQQAFLRKSTPDADGRSRVTLKPAVEDNPPPKGSKATEMTSAVTVSVKITKDDFPFSVSDLINVLSVANAAKTAFEKSIDFIKDRVIDELLPEESIKIPVTYHSSQAVVAKVEDSVEAYSYTMPRVYVDLVSCTGAEGPFTGVGGHDELKISVGGKLANVGFGFFGFGDVLPDTLPAVQTNIKASGSELRHNPLVLVSTPKGPLVSLLLDVRPTEEANSGIGSFVVYPLGDGRYGKHVGWVELLIADEHWPFGNFKGLVYAVDHDDRCPGGGSHFDGS
ncbi:hypothetical protein Q9R19_04590 [Microbacterium sp. ARD32]|uniref:hypothetical protein n=1 Tax=Microbacterium sp. ARD32 TaxID=2962577 RepID=UPI002881E017|nr:hypothetical protein [Microbacterium sp. ARD32]MDT0156902.1 hypothetical protein [Microbacterium sp. ARD32]